MFKDPEQMTEQDVRFYFGDAHATRGDIYERQGNIVDLSYDRERNALVGRVQGSRSEPYKTEVMLGHSMHGIKDLNCNCPLVGFCKHAAALVYRAVRSGILGPTASEPG